MDYKKILQDKFGEIIIDAKLTHQFNNPTLEITTNAICLEEIEDYTRLIYPFLETLNGFDDTKINVEILSRGENLEIQKDELKNKLNMHIKLFLVKPFDSHNVLHGELLEIKPESIVIKWNQKGRIRKINLLLDNINKIEKYVNY